MTHPRVSATLAQLRDATWFAMVGREAPGVVVLDSWQAAVESCSSDEWQDILVDASNRLSVNLARAAPLEWKRWNEVADGLRPVVEELVGEKTGDVVKRYSLPRILVDTVQWDLIHLLLEAEFSDQVMPGFFAAQGYWYVKGHFPCGWRGTPPAGSLVIY